MLNRILKSTLLVCSLFIAAINGLSAQSGLSRMQKGQVAIKTNPLQYFYPEYNLSLELGTDELRSLELKMAVFPFFNYRKTDRKNLGDITAEGFSVHLMRRHYKKANPDLFMAYGLMFKRWDYRDFVRTIEVLGAGERYGILESRSAWVPGVKYLLGKQGSFLQGKGLFEVYAGLSMKLRFESIVWKPEGGQPCVNGPCFQGASSNVFLMPGINFGINIGPGCHRSGKKEATR